MKAIFALFLLFTFSTFGAIQYTNDFSTAVGPELSVSAGALGLVNTPAACVVNGSAYCGLFLGRSTGTPLDTQTVTLSLNALPGHDTVQVNFLFLAAKSWDGNSPFFFGSDVFQVSLDGVVGLTTSFSNFPEFFTQSYPGTFPFSNVPGQTGAVEANKLGYTYFGASGTDPTFLDRERNAVYNITLSFAHTASNLDLTFQTFGLEGWENEGWGLDNLTVSTVVSDETVPEPGSMVLFASGIALAALGRWVKQRRNG
jgi:hypothetical protein